MKTIIAATVFSVVVTPLILLFGYIDWAIYSLSPQASVSRFQAWPWFRYTIAITAFSSLYPFYLKWTAGSNRSNFDNELVVWAFLITFAALLFAYPGREALGLASDGGLLVVLLGTWVVQYIQARVIGSYLWKES